MNHSPLPPQTMLSRTSVGTLAILCAIMALVSPARPQAPVQGGQVSIGEAEATKCEERVAGAVRDSLNKYELALAELQSVFQKAADLEGALAVRAERLRLTQEEKLADTNLVGEPRQLKILQQQTLARMQELSQHLVNETVPRLIEYKKQLTVAGRLDEAVSVRSAIEKLQNLPANLGKISANSTLPADTVILAYSGDRARADKLYKGKSIGVRGTLGGFRPDPTNAKILQVYLGGNAGAAWMQCNFSLDKYSYRDEAQFGISTLVLMNRDNGDVLARIPKGQSMELRGTCMGMEETVRLDKCEVR